MVAVLALTSMANAGILSSSRFPLAMSRDSLAPQTLGAVHERFNTPLYSIGFTGAVLLFLIAVVPVVELAKLASAFQILVFVFVNVALVAFREADLPTYDPEFTAPGYPWVQLFGIVGGVVLLTQMGPVPMGGAVGLIALGAVWYRLYGRERTKREGAALEAIRQNWTERALERTRLACAERGPKRLLIPIERVPEPDRASEFHALARLGSDIAGANDGRIQTVHFKEVPQQLGLEAATDQPSDERTLVLDADDGDRLGIDAAVEFGEIVTHDAKRAVMNFVDHHDIDLVLAEWHPSRWRAELLGADVDWYMKHTAEDFVFVRNRGYDTVDEITLVADQGPFDPLEVVVGDRIASAHDASIQLVATLAPAATEEQVEATNTYLDRLTTFCQADTETTVTTTATQIDALVDAARTSDIVVVGTSAHHVLYDVLFGTVPDRLVERLDCTVLLTHSGRPRRHTFLRAVIDRLLY